MVAEKIISASGPEPVFNCVVNFTGSCICATAFSVSISSRASNEKCFFVFMLIWILLLYTRNQ